MKKIKRGFTLIELLVVIAIIGILAVIVIVNVAGARAKAERAKITSDLSNAIKAYDACITFGGSDPTESVPVSGTASKKVCKTTALGDIDDSTEKSLASGIWPALPKGYSYFSGPVGSVVAVQNDDSGGTSYVSCTTSGCSSDW